MTGFVASVRDSHRNVPGVTRDLAPLCATARIPDVTLPLFPPLPPRGGGMGRGGRRSRSELPTNAPGLTRDLASLCADHRGPGSSPGQCGLILAARA